MSKYSNDTLYAFPDIAAVDRPKREKAELSALLREAHSLTGAAKRLSEIKERIAQLQENYPSGMRAGDLCCLVRWQDGRQTLNKELLVENGVTPEQIKASYKQGNGSWYVELPKIEPET